MRTALVTDSNCGISKKEAESLGIFIVPMPVCIENTFYYEGIDLDHGTFLKHLADHAKIHTSQPSPGDLMSAWENVFAKGFDELLYIPMSSGLSGSCHTACQMAMDYPDKVYVADVRRISVTQRHAVLDALQLAGQGIGASDMKEQLEKNALQSIVFVGVDDLDYLKRGGRITPTAAAMASVLNIKPLLTIGGSKIDAYEKARGRKNCEKRLLEAMRKKVDSFKSQGYDVRIGIAGSFLDEKDLAAWIEMAKKDFPSDELLYDPLTCSISSHVGPNAFGMGASIRIAHP